MATELKRNDWGDVIEGAMGTQPCPCDDNVLRGNTFYCTRYDQPAWKTTVKKCIEDMRASGMIPCEVDDAWVEPSEQCTECMNRRTCEEYQKTLRPITPGQTTLVEE